jgi:S1-C subfamily serine protease
MRRATRQPLRVGDRVFAFGSPFGIKFSMSQGVISGLNRSEGSAFLGMGAGYSNYIQTDAAINPGNSGGPLVDVNGRLVGMNTAIANNRRQNRESEGELQGQSAGIAFAVPLDTIEAIAQQIIRHDFVLRGYLGVGIGRSTPERLARLGFSGRGVIVTNTPNNQPAERAGLEPGDIIVRIANAPTPNSDALRAVISVRAPGQVVPVTVWRDGEELEIPVTLGAAYDVPSGGGLAYIPNSERLGAEGSRQWYRDNVLSEDDEDDESAL